jgi:hypothetical protein
MLNSALLFKYNKTSHESVTLTHKDDYYGKFHPDKSGPVLAIEMQIIDR